MSKTSEPEPTREQLVTDAVNEHGYLLHHKILGVLDSAQNERSKHHWRTEATELPVSLPNEQETRIDIVLRNTSRRIPARVVMECKRSARDFKRWVFFGQEPIPAKCFVERVDLRGAWDSRNEPQMDHRVDSNNTLRDCPVFNYGVEARTNRPGSSQRSSATTAIEDAFQQVTLGQAGLALRLKEVHEVNFRLLPVVVTTAELLEAQFSLDNVSGDRGTLQAGKLQIHSHRWLAVNFHMNEIVSRYSGITTNRTTDLGVDLEARQIRTVFVAEAAHVHEFLCWLERSVHLN